MLLETTEVPLIPLLRPGCRSWPMQEGLKLGAITVRLKATGALFTGELLLLSFFFSNHARCLWPFPSMDCHIKDGRLWMEQVELVLDGDGLPR